MDTMPHDELSLAVPLLVDKEQHRLGCKLRDVESNYSFTSSGSTSTFKTVFHGLNALSGSTLQHIRCIRCSLQTLTNFVLGLIFQELESFQFPMHYHQEDG
jgi:hypothetical protein